MNAENEGNDIERQLIERQEQLEAEQAKQINDAILAKKRADDEDRRQRQIASLAAIAKSTGCLFLVTDSALADALDMHNLPHDEDGLRELIAKRPSIVDHRIGKRFLSGVKEAPKQEKPKTRSDFPNSKDQFTLEQKTEFIHLFPEQWESLPLRPRANSLSLDKMTWEDWRSLSYAQKTAHINTLTEMGRDAEEYIARLPRKQNS